MPIRPANTVNIIRRRLEQAESGSTDAMELIGLQDELARLERKWREQWAEGSDRRKPEHINQLNDHFDRLARLIDRQQRIGLPEVEAAALAKIRTAIQSRSRTW